MQLPTAYIDGYARGWAIDPARAQIYVAHTTVGDPLADALVDCLDSLPQEEADRLIELGMQGGDDAALRTAPEPVREFFDFCYDPPEWLDVRAFTSGYRLFHRNTSLVLAGMVAGVLIEGFTTNIAKSFFLTGRLRDQGIRRLKQNNRHMLEIFMPGGMDRYNDGWALSVRIRLVHATIRRLLNRSEEWNVEELGTPISAAHVGFAISSFSARLLQHMKTLGASFDKEERKSFMAVWRYSGYLMGIPETILFEDEEDALEICRIAKLCEPPISLESLVMATALINSAPLFAGLTERHARRKLASYIFRISRALIGDELADQLNYPQESTRGTLWRFRLLNRVDHLLARLNPSRTQARNKYDNHSRRIDVRKSRDQLPVARSHLRRTVGAVGRNRAMTSFPTIDSSIAKRRLQSCDGQAGHAGRRKQCASCRANFHMQPQARGRCRSPPRGADPMTAGPLERYTAFVLRYRWPVILFAALVMAAATAGAPVHRGHQRLSQPVRRRQSAACRAGCAGGDLFRVQRRADRSRSAPGLGVYPRDARRSRGTDRSGLAGAAVHPGRLADQLHSQRGIRGRPCRRSACRRGGRAYRRRSCAGRGDRAERNRPRGPPGLP